MQRTTHWPVFLRVKEASVRTISDQEFINARHTHKSYATNASQRTFFEAGERKWLHDNLRHCSTKLSLSAIISTVFFTYVFGLHFTAIIFRYAEVKSHFMASYQTKSHIKLTKTVLSQQVKRFR
jgi:hypothetical protein